MMVIRLLWIGPQLGGRCLALDHDRVSRLKAGIDSHVVIMLDLNGTAVRQSKDVRAVGNAVSIGVTVSVRLDDRQGRSLRYGAAPQYGYFNIVFAVLAERGRATEALLHERGCRRLALGHDNYGMGVLCRSCCGRIRSLRLVDRAGKHYKHGKSSREHHA